MSAGSDPEVAAALAREGLRVRRLEPLASFDPAASGRAVYRVELETGGVLKARRLEDAAAARRLFELRRALPAAFAPALARQGAVLIEEWIEGESLRDADLTPARLAEAGRLLAELHALTHAAGESLHERRSTRGWREQSERALASLLAGGRLEAPAAERIRDALARLDPQQARFGLVHSDFCGENLLIDRAGRLRVIDNERIRVDALGFDLGRSWYRWALPPQAWESFQNAYAAALPASDALGSLAFFGLVAVLRSAALRLRLDPPRAQVPLARLREMLAAPRGEWPASRGAAPT